MEAQLLAWEPLRQSEQDVVLIAEAGSGKTLAYLLPLVDKLLEEKSAQRAVPVACADEEVPESAMSARQRSIQKLRRNLAVEAVTRQQRTQRAQQEATLGRLEAEEARLREELRLEQSEERRLHVVVPNVDLEAQVLRVVSGAISGERRPRARAPCCPARPSAGRPPPTTHPTPCYSLPFPLSWQARQLCADTPLAVSSAADPAAAKSAQVVVGTAEASVHMLTGGNVRLATTVVFDEADFMLAGECHTQRPRGDHTAVTRLSRGGGKR